MTHASDLAKLAETFIDRYLVECDARREAEAALAKSEEELATQSANLAAAMAERESLKRALFQMQEAAKDLTARLDAADRVASGLRETIAQDSADLLACHQRAVAAESERDALRRAEAGKGAGDATDEIRDVHGRRAYELSGNPIRWGALSEETRDDWCRSVRRLLDNMEIGPHGSLVASTAERGAIGALVKERDSWRAKAEAAERKREELGARLAELHEAHVRRVDDEARAKAAGEGRPIHRAPATPGPLPLSGDDAWRVFNAEGTHLNGAIAVAGWAFDLGVAHGRTLAQPLASMLTAMAEVGMLVGLDVPQDKTDREVWNVFGNRVREEVKARLAAGADADRRAREALDRVVGAYAKGRADAMRTLAQPADAGRDAVVEMRLCEASRVMLRPDTLYRFTVDRACDRCVAAEQSYRGEAPTSPAKPADRYVVVGFHNWNGEPANWWAGKDGAEEYARNCNAGRATFHRDRRDDPDRQDWAVVDTQPATTPQPSPRAVGVDAERLAEAFEAECRAAGLLIGSSSTADIRGNAMRRALATIGAQPLVALTASMLADPLAIGLSEALDILTTFDERRKAAEAILRRLGPVAIPAGIDHEALTWARRYIDERTVGNDPDKRRVLACLDAILTGQPNAVTVEEIVEAWNMSIGDGEKAIRRILAPHVGKVIAGAVKP